jgi:hypothetical protein
MQRLAWFCFVLLASACAGRVGGASRASEQGACSDKASAPALVRRLNHVEYNRTLRDLFPGISVPKQTVVIDLPIHGFENATRSLNPSAVLIEQYADAARIVAGLALYNLHSLAECTRHVHDLDCARQLIEQFGARAYRRPLTAVEQQSYVALFEQELGEGDFVSAVDVTLQAFLQSPHFLYRIENGVPDGDRATVPLTDYEMASRLSYLIWQSMPDATLFEAAARGELRTSAQVANQARRMLADPRATAAVQDFHRQWLGFDELMDENKDPKQFPTWNDTLRAAMREESDRFVAHLYDSGADMLAGLLTSRTTFVNAPLAKFYGVPHEGDDWQMTSLPEGERSGILTRGNFLAAHAHTSNGSPPLRGVAVLDRLLCDPLPPPPPNANLSPPVNKGPAPRTNRDLFAERTSPAACRDCHVDIDGIGFGFEAYDAAGAFRTEDNSLPVNATGELRNTQDIDGPFNGAVELSTRLAGSQQVRACMVRNWFRYAFAREPMRADACALDAYRAALDKHQGDLRELLVAIASSYPFMHRAAADRQSL